MFTGIPCGPASIALFCGIDMTFVDHVFVHLSVFHRLWPLVFFPAILATYLVGPCTRRSPSTEQKIHWSNLAWMTQFLLAGSILNISFNAGLVVAIGINTIVFYVVFAWNRCDGNPAPWPNIFPRRLPQ